jgi:hypothetical protein
MFKSMPTDFSGYKLINKGDGLYKLVSSHGSFVGTASQVTTYAVLEHGFSRDEIEFGIQEMNAGCHNAAEYGIFKSFMFSYDYSEIRAIQ